LIQWKKEVLHVKKMILGLDVASYKTGWCLLECDESKKTYKYIDSGIFEISSKDKMAGILGYRINFVRSSVKLLIDQYGVDHVAIEEVYNGHKNASSVLHRVHGSLIEMLYNAGLNYTYFPNTTIKKIIVKGNATKEELAQEVQKILNIKLNFKEKDETYDESDAIGVGLSYVFVHVLKNVELKKKTKKKRKGK
jgi:crossover junction endodeoxyribonuclease RuvC